MLEFILKFFIPIALANTDAIAITEVFPNPEGQDLNEEYIVIKNTSNSEISLQDLYLDDQEGESPPYSLENYTIPPLGEIILESNETGISINNEEDQVRILDSNLEPILEINIKGVPEGEKYNPSNPNTSTPVISGIFPNPEGPDGEDEWVKIFNPNLTVIDLSLYYLDDEEGGSSPFQLTGQLYPSEEKTVYSTLTLNNSTDEVRILDLNGNVVDSISYESTEEGEIIFAKTPETTPTTVATTVQITEIMPNPEEDEASSEWIEIQNTGTETINLAGLLLDDSEDGSSPFELPETILEPLEFAIFYRSESSLALNNSSDSVRILTPQETVLDEVEYEKTKEGLSYQLTESLNPLTEEKTLDWKWNTPSPGTENIATYTLTTTVIEFTPELNLLITETNNQTYEFQTLKLDISEELTNTVFQKGAELTLTYQTINGENEITDFEIEMPEAETSTITIENSEEPLYKQLLPYITTILAVILLSIFESRKQRK